MMMMMMMMMIKLTITTIQIKSIHSLKSLTTAKSQIKQALKEKYINTDMLTDIKKEEEKVHKNHNTKN
jgi:hypothetical protein